MQTEIQEHERIDQEYVENLTASILSATKINNGKLREWTPKLIGIARELEDFINNKEQKRPDVEPGYGALQTTALEQLINNPMVARYLLPCVNNALASILHRMNAANDIKVEVDNALIDYTATYPGSLSDSYLAATRLHGRIEQLLEIYGKLYIDPDDMNKIMDKQSCDEK